MPSCSGCHTQHVQSSLDDSERLWHEFVFWQAMAAIAGLKSPQLEWARIKQTFVDSYWTTSVIESSKAYLHVFLWQAPQSPTINAARDALSLIHVGVRYRDKRLLAEGRSRHLAALKCMREEIRKPNAAFDDCVLGAAYSLGHSEMYSVIAARGKGWRGHLGAFQRILQIRGPQSMVSPFANALLQSLRTVEVAESFLSRKASYLASPEWIAGAAGSHADAPATQATKMALQVGVHLQEADRLCGTCCPDMQTIVAQLNEMMMLEVDLKKWLVDAYRWSDGKLLPHKLVRTSTYASFYERCGDLAMVFPQSIEFPSFLSATSHTFIHVCLLLLRQAIASVARLHPYPLLGFKNQESVLNAAVEQYATTLAESIAHLAHGEHGFAGIVACGAPLHYASLWYRNKQNPSKEDRSRLTWFDHVTEFLQRDVVVGGSIDLQKPVFTWWMLPDIFSPCDNTESGKP